jgi:DNA-binding XRE family transcriptional regulator
MEQYRFCRKLRQARHRHGWTQVALSQQTGLSQGAISRHETQHPPDYNGALAYDRAMPGECLLEIWITDRKENE